MNINSLVLLDTIYRNYVNGERGPDLGVGGPSLQSRYDPQVFYVNSAATNASALNSGASPSRPLTTIAAAIALCVANRGDVIIVGPGHVETVIAAAGLALSVAGVSILGVGNGAKRPTINFTTATTATMTVTGADCSIDNFLFTGGIDALVGPISIQAADFRLTNFETRDVTGQATRWIITTAAADRLYIGGDVTGARANCATAAGGATWLTVVGCDGVVVENFDLFGNWDTAAIEQKTTAGTNHRYGGGMKQNYIQNSFDSTTPVAVTMKSDTTGHIGPNINARIGVDSTSNTTNITEAFVGAAMQFFQPLNVVNLGGEVAMLTNIPASTDA